MSWPGPRFFRVPEPYLAIAKTLGPTAFIVLMALCRRADRAGSCFPSIATLCADTGLSELCVRERLGDLELNGVVTITRSRTETNLNSPNIYQLASSFEAPTTTPGHSTTPPRRRSTPRRRNTVPGRAEYSAPAVQSTVPGRPQNQIQELNQELLFCSELDEPASEHHQSSPIVLVFPTVGSGAKQFGLNQAKIDEYRESYPGLDVMAECKRARQWCVDNPKKRKTADGMPRFLNSWLSKEQNKGGRFAFEAAPTHQSNGHAVTAMDYASQLEG